MRLTVGLSELDGRVAISDFQFFGESGGEQFDEVFGDGARGVFDDEYGFGSERELAGGRFVLGWLRYESWRRVLGRY